jgi:hypothetical protein
MGRVNTLEIVIFAERFNNGAWDVLKHICSPDEGLAVVEAARLRAKLRSPSGRLIHDDILEAAGGIFNVAHDPTANSQDGDLRVYCVCLDKLVIGAFEKIRHHSPKSAEPVETVKVAVNGPLCEREAKATGVLA